MDLANRPVIDLKYRHFMQRHGDIMAYGTWWRDEVERRQRPALVLIPRHMDRDKHRPFIIPMDRMYLWHETLGDVGHAEKQAGLCAAYLGLDPFEPRVRRRILSIVRDHMGDMYSMPSLPPADNLAPVAELLWTNPETGKETYVEVKQNV